MSAWHYSTKMDRPWSYTKSLCGRVGHNFTNDIAAVTCKWCLRKLPAAPPVAAAPGEGEK